MAKRPKLRMTNADYVAIAVSPALIMALVGSLVFFLIEVLYVGQYQARLIYVFSLFIFATVLIGRIAIEMGTERAAMFALPLGIAMFLVLAKFVPHASPYSHLINIVLLGLVWWSAHKLTWDCTLIDDNEDASGEGLMQHIGVDDLVTEELVTENELLADDETNKKKTPHTPGLWVLYFSLAALPLFGIGQKWIPVSDVGRRQYAFGLLAVYVAAGLALLVTTSFLGLRRYLRQRRIEMPTPMAATWVVTGGVLIAVVMLLAALVPRPNAEYAISQVPWQVEAPSDLAASRTSFGEDGTEDDRADNTKHRVSKVLNDETDPDAIATRESENPTTTSEEGEKQSNSGEASEEASDEGSEEASEEASEPGEPEKQVEQQQSSEQSEPTEQVEQASDDGETSDTPADTSPEASPSKGEAEKQDDPKQKDGESDPASGPVRSRPSLPDFVPSIGGLTGVLKLALYVAIALALGFLAWRNRRAIAKTIREIVELIREFLGRLFGGGSAKPASGADDETEKIAGPPPRAFASFADPFANGQARSMPPDELVRYTFEAFEAWARERGHPRSPDQTPSELIQLAIPAQSPLLTEAQYLARLYNKAAYAPNAVSSSEVAGLSQFWTLLRQSSETPLEPVS